MNFGIGSDIGYLYMESNTDMTFGTNGGEKMRITSAGNVGIGITTPQAPLSFANVVGSKIDFYHNTTSSDRYGIEVQSSELRIHSGAQGSNTGGITFGKKTTSTFTEAMRITNAGNVGINCTPSYKLQWSDGTRTGLLDTNIGAVVIGSVSNDALALYTNLTEKMRITSTGNVGIGTGASIATDVKLHIKESTSNSYARLRLQGSNRGGIIEMYNGTLPVSSWTTDQSGNTHFATSGAYGNISTTTRLTILTGGNVGIGTTSPGCKFEVNDGGGNNQIRLTRSGSTRVELSTNANEGELSLYRSNNIATVYISSYYDSYFNGGNVGIGTTSPLDPLNVQSTGASDYAFRIFRSTSTTQGLAGFYEGSANQGQLYLLKGDNTVGAFLNSNGDSYLNGGNVGIGVANPLQKLSVHGNIELVGEDVGNCGVRYIKYNCPDDASYNVLGLTTSTANFITKVGINKTSPAVKLDVSDSIAGSGFTNGLARFENTIETSSGGAGVLNVANNYQGGFGTLIKFWFEESSVASINFNSSTNAVVYNTTSDYRLKEDLQQFDGLEIVDQIKTYNYKWKKADARGYGALAHELQEVFPDAVTGEKDGEDMQGVDYSTLVPVLIKSIQELKAEIELLKQQINN
jgi:hypothetical protein